MHFKLKKIKIIDFLKKSGPILLIITAYLLFSSFSFKNLGITNDENPRYQNGADLYKFYQNLKTTGEIDLNLFTHIKKTDFIYSGYTGFLYLLSGKNIKFSLYHLYNYLFAIPLILGIYFLSFKATNNKILSFLVTAIFTSYPTFLGLAPINPIDIPFATSLMLCLIFISFIDLNNIFSKKNILILLGLGICAGFLQSNRLIGLVIFPVLAAYFLYFNQIDSIKKATKPLLFIFILLTISTIFMIGTWPQFWLKPIDTFINYIKISASYIDWRYVILYDNQFYDKSERPWHYLPVLQIFTYPIISIIGTILSFKFLKKELKNKYFFLTFTTLILTYILYFGMQPIIYDGIRHFFFLLPLMVVISAVTINLLLENLKNKIIKKTILSLISLEIIWQIYNVYSTFPLHYIYFNPIFEVAGKNYDMYDTDYFGISFKQAVQGASKTLTSKNLLNLKTFTCDNNKSLYLYGKNLRVENNLKNAEIIICDSKNIRLLNLDASDVIFNVIHRGYPLNVVFYNKNIE